MVGTQTGEGGRVPGALVAVAGIGPGDEKEKHIIIHMHPIEIVYNLYNLVITTIRKVTMYIMFCE